jgi:rubrerythrin
MATMTDQDKVRALLPHWIEHNAEHAAEFRRWAEKVLAVGQEEVAADIALAATELGRVNQTLSAALEKAGGPLEGHGA